MSALALDRRAPAVMLPGILLALLVGILLLVYRDTFGGLWALWIDPENVTYSHGALLVALSAGITLHTLWRDPRALRLEYSLPGAVLLIAAGILWVLSTLMVINVGAMLSAWLVLVGAVWAVFGLHGLRRLALPLCLVVFAIPLWSMFNEVLRLTTAHAVSVLLGMTGVSHLLEGATIGVAAGRFYVDDNCTGLRQLVVAMPLALLFAGWTGLRPLYGGLVFLLAVVLSFLLNTLRIYIVVVAGVMTDMQHYLVREDHVMLGWVLFGLGMTAFFVLAGRLIPDGWFRHAASAPGAVGRGTAGTRRSHGVAGTMVMLSLALAIVLPWTVNRSVTGQDPQMHGVLSLPSGFGAWTLDVRTDAPDLAGVFQGADVERAVVYRRGDGARVMLHVAWFHAPREGHKLVAWGNRTFDPDGWRQLAWTRQLTPTGTLPAAVREDLLAAAQGDRQRLVWSWYQVGSRMPITDMSAVMAGLFGALCGRPDGAMWVLTPVSPGEPAGDRALLEDFLYAGGIPLTGVVRDLSHQVHAGSWCRES